MKLKKDNWMKIKLDDILTFKNGFNFNKGNLENGWRVVGVADFKDFFKPNYDKLERLVADRLPSEDYLLQQNDLLFVRSNGNKNLVGRTLLITEVPFPITFSAFCIRGRFINKDVSPVFFTYYSKSNKFKSLMRTYVQGTNITNISQGLLSNITVQLPPFEQQKQLANLFQSLDGVISDTESQKRKLKALRQSLINTLHKSKPKFGSLLEASLISNTSIGQVAAEISDRTENPSTSGFDRFVGLENFESGELLIKQWGTTSQLVSAMKLFKSGDILFARRNAYLKRASQADFDGVCSGDAIVMRVNENLILPEYLTLILNTKEFWDYAIANAAGTMSKRVKWRDLAIYSFDLPDIGSQSKVCGVIDELSTLISKFQSQISSLEKLKNKLLDEVLD